MNDSPHRSCAFAFDAFAATLRAWATSPAADLAPGIDPMYVQHNLQHLALPPMIEEAVLLDGLTSAAYIDNEGRVRVRAGDVLPLIHEPGGGPRSSRDVDDEDDDPFGPHLRLVRALSRQRRRAMAGTAMALHRALTPVLSSSPLVEEEALAYAAALGRHMDDSLTISVPGALEAVDAAVALLAESVSDTLILDEVSGFLVSILVTDPGAWIDSRTLGDCLLTHPDGQAAQRLKAIVEDVSVELSARGVRSPGLPPGHRAVPAQLVLDRLDPPVEGFLSEAA